MAGNDGALTYDDLSEVYRMENNSPQLSTVRKDFYIAAQELVDSLSREYDRLTREDPESLVSDGILSRKKNVVKNLKKVVELRMNKVAGLAMRSAMGANNSIEELTPEEKIFYNSVLAASKEMWKLSERRKKTFISQDISEIVMPAEKPAETVAEEKRPVTEDIPLSEIPFDDFPDDMGSPADEIIEEEEQVPVPEEIAEQTVPETEDAVEETVEEPAPEQVQEPVQVPVSVTDIDDDDIVIIRILEDLPPFSGPEVNYDLKKEDIVRMPGVMAKALINRGKARIVLTA